MLTETYRSASPMGEAGESLIAAFKSAFQELPVQKATHSIRMQPGYQPENPVYRPLIQMIGDTLDELSEDSYVAKTVKTHGGSTVIKYGDVAPGNRQDEMDWHIDIRSALILGTVVGTETLSGDASKTITTPAIRRWLHAVDSRTRTAEIPNDTDLGAAGLTIEPLQPNNWYEIGSDVVHRAPKNETGKPLNRLFIGVTPPYFLS